LTIIYRHGNLLGMARRETFTEALWRLKPGESRVFTEGKRETMRTIAWRLGKSEDRTYQCRSTPDGYQVWRTA
jgi:hypothetical protein